MARPGAEHTGSCRWRRGKSGPAAKSFQMPEYRSIEGLVHRICKDARSLDFIDHWSGLVGARDSRRRNMGERPISWAAARRRAALFFLGGRVLIVLAGANSSGASGPNRRCHSH